MENKKSARGGKRKGAGRKENGYVTKQIGFRVREDLIKPVQELVRKFIKENPPT